MTVVEPGAEVRERVRRDFPPAVHDVVLRALADYGDAEHEGEADRVHLDIVVLAAGDLDLVGHYVRRAKADYRDVVFWAEHWEPGR